MTTGKKVLIGCAIALGVAILAIAAIIGIALFATSGISDVAKSQLSALREGNIEKAYSYTSKDFQAATNLDQFKAFVNQYPALKNNDSASFTTRSTENDQGTLEGTLKSKDGGTTPITFKFVKENKEWKILGISLQPSGASVQEPAPNQNGTSSTAIVNIMINDKTNKDGYVDENKLVFSTSTAKIQVSAYVQDASKGMTVDALLLYTATGDQVGPATNTVQDQGNIISNFEFSKPTNGWPVGDYKVAIRISTGEVKDVDFQVK